MRRRGLPLINNNKKWRLPLVGRRHFCIIREKSQNVTAQLL